MNETKFWENVDQTGSCWLWRGALRNGYGELRWKGKTTYAHRLAWELLVGEPPSRLDHRHTCPKTCVNPVHLRPATQQQNLENRAGPPRHNTSGYRGVHWSKATQKWQVRVTSAGRQYHFGLFEDIEDANQAAIAGRNLLHTHNDADRLQS